LKIEQSGSTGISFVKRSDSVEVHVRVGGIKDESIEIFGYQNMPVVGVN
jgi:hypothetical protein